MNSWKLVKSPPLAGQLNMELDLGAFKGFEKREIGSILRLYSWKPKCISLGYSQRLEREIDREKAVATGWDIVRRPTGGGIVFHNEAEITYSLVTELDNPILPKGLVPSYKKLSEAIVYGLRLLGIEAEIRAQNNEHRTQNTGLCFAYPAEYEVVVAGRKIVGSAQKRGKRTLLQQGSIFVKKSEPEIFSVLKMDNKEYNALCIEDILGKVVDFETMSNALVEGFKNTLGVEFKE